MRSTAGKFVCLILGCSLFVLLSVPVWATVNGKILGVQLDPKAKNVIIRSKGSIGKYEARVIGRPNRLFIDFEDTRFAKLPRRIKGNRHGIREIRTGYYKGRARVVMDFSANPVPSFQIRRKSDRIVIEFGKSVPKSALALIDSKPKPKTVSGRPSPPATAKRMHFPKAAAASGGKVKRDKSVKKKSAQPQERVVLRAPKPPRNLSDAKAKRSKPKRDRTKLKRDRTKPLIVAQNTPTPSVSKMKEPASPVPKLDRKQSTDAVKDKSNTSSSPPAQSTTQVSTNTGIPSRSFPEYPRMPRRGGRGGRVREVRPPVTPPTPDPRLLVQEITELKFIQVGHNARLVVRGGDGLDYRVNKVSPTKVRIDLINAEIPKVHQKPLRTDRFSTSVEMIIPGTQSIFVQLKDTVPYQIQKKKGVLMIDFPPPRLALTRDQAKRLRPGDEAGRGEYEKRRLEALQRREAVQIMREESIRQANETRERQIRTLQKELEELMKERREIERKFQITPDPEVFSKPVTMDFQGISLRNAFRLLAEQAGINIILGRGVRGSTTLRLFQVPLGQVLDTILRTNGLDRELIGNVMRIDRRGVIRASKRRRLTQQRRLLRNVGRNIRRVQEQIRQREQEREEAFRQLAAEQKATETPAEDITRVETVGSTETIEIDGEPVTLVLVQIRLSYANAAEIRNVLQCVFNRRCPGLTGRPGETELDAERRFMEYLAQQGFSPYSPGGQARLRSWRQEQRASRRTAAAEAIAQQTTGEQAVGALRGAGVDPRLQRILAHTVMWANTTYNMLFIKDLPERIEEMKKLIATLDIPRAEVMIEARIVQANRDWGRGLGILWGGRNNQVGPLTDDRQVWWGMTGNQAVTGANTPTGQTIPGNNIPSTFAINLPATVQGLTSIPGMGMQFGLLSNTAGNNYISELDARIQMGEATSNAKTIGRPKVQVQDGRRARIRNGVQVPYTTVSADGAQTQLVDVDLSLSITPRIYPDGRIRLIIRVTNDSLGAFTAAGQIINRQQASTVLVVKDGETAVIGGILQEQDNTSRGGITGLMNVPVLNFLFSNRTRAVLVQELLVFITPSIVKKPPPAA